MKEKLEKILEEVDYWKDDLMIRIRPTGRVEIPPDYPVERLFQNLRMWEEMLSVLIERFSGDTLLASQEVNNKCNTLFKVNYGALYFGLKCTVISLFCPRT